MRRLHGPSGFNPPYSAPAAREVMIKTGDLVPTTWANIFAEIVMCQNCARMYPSPECRHCEASIQDSMKPSRMVKKTKFNVWWHRSRGAARIRRVIKWFKKKVK